MIGTLFNPDAWWDFIEPKIERGNAPLLLCALAIIGGLFVALATEIGVRNFNTDWNYVAGYGAQPNRGWTAFVALWAVAALGPFVQGLVSANLLQLYVHRERRPRPWLRAIAVAVIGSIPTYIAGLSLIMLPGMLIVVIAFLVSCAWWTSGSRRLLGVIDGDAAEYVAVSVVLSGALLVLLSASVPL